MFSYQRVIEIVDFFIAEKRREMPHVSVRNRIGVFLREFQKMRLNSLLVFNNIHINVRKG